VLTGIGTVQEDDPRLDVRHVAVRRQPLAVIVDSRLGTPTTANMFIEGRPLLIYGAADDAVRRGELEKAGATVIDMPGPGGKVDLAAMLRDLARREVNELHVEAGHKLNGSLLREGLVDELLVYLAPKLLGPGRDMANIGPLAQLSQALPLEFASIQSVGPDLRIRALVKRP
jgi:diaminohydroxyphosphoribosylaminopyrimidine deaminase/5-amino-6-(5-phosphoribosylamino)uracil reductase